MQARERLLKKVKNSYPKICSGEGEFSTQIYQKLKRKYFGGDLFHVKVYLYVKASR